MREQSGSTTRSAKVAARDLRKRETKAEQVLWAALRDRRLNGIKFRRQHPIERYVLDFYCAEARLGIELDGEIHKSQSDMDEFRTEFLVASGIKIVRFNNGEVLTDLSTVLEQIAGAHAELIDNQPNSQMPLSHAWERG